MKRTIRNLLLRLLGRMYQIGRDYNYSQTINDFISTVGHKDGSIYLQMPLFAVGAQYMSFGDGFHSQPGLRIECIDEYNGIHYTPQLKIGKNFSANYYCHIGCIDKITIGDNVLIGSRVLITDHSHGVLEHTDVPWEYRKLYSKGPVVIGDNVWIGENACIMPGVTIGEGSVIGANAVVTHDVPPYSLAVGVPAKIVKTIHDNEKITMDYEYKTPDNNQF